MFYVLLGVLAIYLFAAYLLIPFAWKSYARHHPSFDDNPRITQTSDGHPGDPLNVSLIGTQAQIDTIMQAAKWYPAAALGLKSDLKIAADTVLSRLPSLVMTQYGAGAPWRREVASTRCAW